MEPTLAGVVESYVDLGAFYDRRGLLERREEIRSAFDYRIHYRRANRLLGAVTQLMEEDRSLLLTPELEARERKRARGILSREVKSRGTHRPGAVKNRFLSAVTCQGTVCQWETVEILCSRIYELADSWGLGESLLLELEEGCRAAGYEVIRCLHPLLPGRLLHLLVPELSLAFVTGTPEHPWPGRPYRRIRVDAMTEEGTLRGVKPRLKFSRRVGAALLREAVDALADGKTRHDQLEALYHPYVDFSGVEREADRIAGELLDQG